MFFLGNSHTNHKLFVDSVGILFIRHSYTCNNIADKEQKLKVVTDELNQAAIEAKKNAPKREKTCYFERAKMMRDAARLAKKPKTPKDKGRGKQGIE